MNQQIPAYAELDWQQIELIMRAARRERSDFIAAMIRRLRRRKDSDTAQHGLGGMAQAG
ncbi:hypothetical protein [Alkalilimnicola sp. S0819]|uniref:hypothetical protein n=1 Tax=Alkalilimnicola sp. S0819 TaxID=2613922 RepID=UPI0018698F8A|nr:hypothetical protein [Alkalilimnicola sp. S0819]